MTTTDPKQVRTPQGVNQELREKVARLLDSIIEECGNTGFGNPIVNERMIDRIHDDAVEAKEILAALHPERGE